jgi:putative metalloprotease
MKKLLLSMSLLVAFSFAANAQFGKIKLDKAVDAASKGVKAMTLTDAEIAQYCQEYIDWMDAHNPVCSVTDKDAGKKAVAERLDKIASGLTEVNGVKLDIKAYYVVDVNAFALANGSVRVFAGLMDLMTDDQILAVIGHELGHVNNKDSKEGFKKALLTSALKDAVGSTGNAAAALTDSQLGSLGEALANAQFSQKQETAADDYAYKFLKDQGKDPQSMASALGVLAKLESEAGVEDSKKKQLFSSHPGLKDRIAKIEKKK